MRTVRGVRAASFSDEAGRLKKHESTGKIPPSRPATARIEDASVHPKTARPHRASSLGFLRTVRWRGLGVGSDGPGRRRLILGGCQCSARSGHPTRCEARRLVGEAKPNWPRLNFDSKSRNRTLLARHRSPSRSGSSRHAGGRRGHCHGMNGSPRKTEIGILTAKRWGIRSHEVPFVT